MRLLIAVLAALAIVPSVAQADRTDDFNKPVLFVPGPEQADPSCSPFDDMTTHFSEYTTTVGGQKVGLTGQLIGLGLYAGSDGCSEVVGAARGDSIAQLGAKLAAWINQAYTSQRQPVDIVAHGGAGLVVRSALAQQPKLMVEDVVALGAPNGGSAALTAACGSRAVCAELAPGSDTVKGLARNPQGAGGTDWSVIGSEADTVVPADSAVAMDAEHKTVYRAGGPSHDGLLTDSSDNQDAKIRYSHGAGKWVDFNQAPHAVERAAEDVIFGGGASAEVCGLQATQPELCGQTPVILVPGFGASQIDCTSQFGTGNMWPQALFNSDRWIQMSLADDGKSPAGTSECARTAAPNGHVIQNIAGLKDWANIHGKSWAWLQRIAPGRAYEFGWDFRKGPDQSIAVLDRFIDAVRARHGVQRVAIVSHSYGGLLTRWYIDDPQRARKITRVANFGSPWWGAPKAWFALAYGYESPAGGPIDSTTKPEIFGAFTHNLTGLYYLIPPQAWFDGAPPVLRNWLEVDDRPVKSVTGVVDAIRAFKGNAAIAADVARNHEQHIDGFSRKNGVDWRTFIGSGLGTLGHVRAYSDSKAVQYSWINGDGTVPLFSQRQSAKAGDDQLGDDVPTYNFCGIPHMGEMEDSELQDAVTPFVTTGADPVVDGDTLKRQPCSIDASEFVKTGKEDERSLWLSKLASAGAASVKARAAQAPARMTVDEAERAGLIEVMHDAGRLTFITHQPVVVHSEGAGSVQVTPITGEGKRGKARVYDGPVTVSADGAKTSSPSPSRPADSKPPRTTARRRGGKLTLKARDASGVSVTMVKVGRAKAKPYKRALKVRRGTTVRYWSIDTFGNVEKQRINKAG
jgi:triacylglycerol esterase/lipase EstA (alpha/beta hydrolase family)